MLQDVPAIRAMVLNWPRAGYLTVIRLATPFLSVKTGRPRQNTFQLDRPSLRSSQSNEQDAVRRGFAEVPPDYSPDCGCKACGACRDRPCSSRIRRGSQLKYSFQVY